MLSRRSFFKKALLTVGAIGILDFESLAKALEPGVEKYLASNPRFMIKKIGVVTIEGPDHQWYLALRYRISARSKKSLRKVETTCDIDQHLLNCLKAETQERYLMAELEAHCEGIKMELEREGGW